MFYNYCLSIIDTSVHLYHQCNIIPYKCIPNSFNLTNMSIELSFSFSRIMVMVVNMILMVVHLRHLDVHILITDQENKTKRKDDKFN